MAQNTKTTMLIKLDKKDKAAGHKIAEEMGIPLSTLMTAQLKKLVRERRVEFDVPLIPTAKAARWIREARKEFDEGKSKGFATMEELIKDLHN